MPDLFNANLTSCSSCVNRTINKTTPEIYNALSYGSIFLSVYAIFLLFAVVGNGLVCWIVAVNRRMHNVTNYLLVNLAVSDLLMALSTNFQVIDFAVKDLNIGDVGCKFQINMVNIPYGCSVLTLTFIAFERYCAVCKPMCLQDFKVRMKWIIPALWLMAAAIYFPTLYYCGSRFNTETDQLSCDCTDRWPSLRAKNIYGIGIVMVLYALPLIVVAGLYSKVIRRLKEAIPGDGQRNHVLYQSRRGVVRMLLVAVFIFFVAWTPYNILYLLKRLEVNYRSVYPYVWYPSLLLAFIHCVCNPVVYCLLGNNFRKSFKSVLCCCNCRLLQMTLSVLGYTSTSRSRSQTRQSTAHINMAVMR